MRAEYGRPVIESGDSPLVIDEALHRSLYFWQEHTSEEQAFQWQKRAADAWEALDDGFGIIEDMVINSEGEALLYISFDELKLALTGYRGELTTQGRPETDEDILAIYGLLAQIGQFQSQS